MAVPTAPLFTSSTPPVIEPAPFAEKLPTRAKNPPVSCPVIVKAYEPLRLATLYGPVVGGGAGVPEMPPLPPPHAISSRARAKSVTSANRLFILRQVRRGTRGFVGRFTGHLRGSFSLVRSVSDRRPATAEFRVATAPLLPPCPSE